MANQSPFSGLRAATRQLPPKAIRSPRAMEFASGASICRMVRTMMPSLVPWVRLAFSGSAAAERSPKRNGN